MYNCAHYTLRLSIWSNALDYFLLCSYYVPKIIMLHKFTIPFLLSYLTNELYYLWTLLLFLVPLQQNFTGALTNNIKLSSDGAASSSMHEFSLAVVGMYR